jgi:hypothetical protein
LTPGFVALAQQHRDLGFQVYNALMKLSGFPSPCVALLQEPGDLLPVVTHLLPQPVQFRRRVVKLFSHPLVDAGICPQFGKLEYRPIPLAACCH